MTLFRILIFGFGFPVTAGAGDVDFARDIRPILSDRCFKCHGLDEGSRKADLSLHSFESATKDKAIVPGKADHSLILERILSDDPDELMPPPASNKRKLSPAEAAKFKEWINSGAKYEKHWAFVPPREHPVNAPESESGNPIDGFVANGHKTHGLSFSKPAEPHRLAKRIYLDLIGMTPTPEETARFVSNYRKNPKSAVSKLTGDLLNRPQYGERWARPWLDLARYADTNGYEKDRPRSIWPYRDWVINALNADMPYDRFSIEQLAGDMLPNATLDQRIATGFHRNTMINEEGGIDPLEYRYLAMVDRVATTGTVWLGLTTGCAQCHTHKFDPITHTDYFSLFALLNNADEPNMDVPTPEIETKKTALEAKIKKMETELVQKTVPAEFAKWKTEQLAQTASWEVIAPAQMKSSLPVLSLMEDGSVFASGDFTKRDVYELKFDLKKPAAAIRIEALPDERLPAHGPGVAYYEGRHGDFFLSEIEVKLNGKPVKIKSANVDFGKVYVGNGKSDGATVFDRNFSSGWSTATREGERHELVIYLENPIPAGQLDLKMIFERHFVAALGRFRVSTTSNQKEIKARGGEISDLTKTGDRELKRLYVSKNPQLTKLRKQIPASSTTMVMREWVNHKRKSYRHHRGEYLQPKEEVTPAVPAVFNSLPKDKPANRLTLAQWLVSEDNPLVARVAVNRAWRAFFGRGIVYTAGDFGYQSELPSHPELLDFLAVKFVDEGWSMKNLHKLIVTSRTYQQDSTITKSLLETDPQNVYLARGPRFRIEGEMIRDSALRSSGILTLKTGGPSVYPPQPASVAAAAYGNTKWPVSKGAGRYRRSLYTFSKRTAPFAAYLSFDGPSGENCLARRERSNTPLQALTLLNDEMFTEASIAIAKDTASISDDREVASGIFLRILCRPATENELEKLIAFFNTQLGRLEKGELKADKILGDKNSRLAAWSMVARAIYNLDEAITKG